MKELSHIRIKLVQARALRFVTLGALAVLFPVFPLSAAPASGKPAAAPPARLERGSYLVNTVGGCMRCHSERDWTLYCGPIKPGTAGGGAYVTLFGEPYFYSANITPAALGRWSDREATRALTLGVRKDGTAVQPQTSHEPYAHLSQEDVSSVVAYLRTLQPVQSKPPGPKTGTGGHVRPRPWKPEPAPSPASSVAYGRYLVNLAECSVCHGPDLSGGRTFKIPGQEATVYAANITPDMETGIGTLTRPAFIGRFKAFASPESQRIPVPAESVNTVMPWIQFAGMTEQDLGAIYDYLRTFPAVKKEVPVLPGKQVMPPKKKAPQ
jgi:mono/diheme cytochrome c family protein